MSSGEPELVWAYVNIAEEENKALSEAYKVSSTPLVIFSRGGEEIWRMTAPDNREEVVELVHGVLSGVLTWTSQRALLSGGSLSASEMFRLAGAYQKKGDLEAASDIYESMPQRCINLAHVQGIKPPSPGPRGRRASPP